MGDDKVFVRNLRGIYGSFPILVPISKRIIRGLYGNYPPAFLMCSYNIMGKYKVLIWSFGGVHRVCSKSRSGI